MLNSPTAFGFHRCASTWQTDGFVGQWHDVHLGSFATGGTGLIMVEATGVVPEGRISIGCPSIEDDEHAAAFAPIIDFAHQHNVKMGIQLAHAGRKAGTALPWADHRMATPEEGGWQSVSSSAIAFEGYAPPRALTVDEIHQLTKDFASAAQRSIEVGFDVIELHAAHGLPVSTSSTLLLPMTAPMNTADHLKTASAF
jgi:2,4-dienoyl-CoA reductase-like NADH-dependent reductase (Old Yellow Enzyme family)